MNFGVNFYIIFCLMFSCSLSNNFCMVYDKELRCDAFKVNSKMNAGFIFYDVNPPEGFNLRRDVYLRMAVFVKKLPDNWFLVLPPWPHLYHWSNDLQNQKRLPWNMFFNVSQLSSFVPVVEMNEFLETGEKVIDHIYVLQHFKDIFKTKNFEDRMKIEGCVNNFLYKRISDGNYTGYFWGYKNLTARKVDCLSFNGFISQLKNILSKTDAKTVMFDHAEIALHDRFGDKTYWDARRSMKFADHLILEAAEFQKKKLNLSDDVINAPWPNKNRTILGGNYICVHLRRQDFLNGRSKEVPSIKGAAKQIQKILKETSLKTVFVATDASHAEKLELKFYLQKYKIITYEPTPDIRVKFKDGGIAIIEQIICSKARKFFGTFESTFSFRIQEEREILGFSPETTFNRLCGDNETKCRQPSKWLIIY